jgi:integrase
VHQGAHEEPVDGHQIPLWGSQPKRQAARQAVERAEWAEAYEDNGLVFARVNGAPLRPDWILDRFQDLTEQAGLPRVRLHDLRHLAATLMLTSGVPPALVYKTLRHAKSGSPPTCTGT